MSLLLKIYWKDLFLGLNRLRYNTILKQANRKYWILFTLYIVLSVLSTWLLRYVVSIGFFSIPLGMPAFISSLITVTIIRYIYSEDGAIVARIVGFYVTLIFGVAYVLYHFDMLGSIILRGAIAGPISFVFAQWLVDRLIWFRWNPILYAVMVLLIDNVLFVNGTYLFTGFNVISLMCSMTPINMAVALTSGKIAQYLGGLLFGRILRDID